MPVCWMSELLPATIVSTGIRELVRMAMRGQYLFHSNADPRQRIREPWQCAQSTFAHVRDNSVWNHLCMRSIGRVELAVAIVAVRDSAQCSPHATCFALTIAMYRSRHDTCTLTYGVNFHLVTLPRSASDTGDIDESS